MISKKPYDAISATQTDNNRFNWLSELPETCKLSSTMKEQFEKIIRLLLTRSNNSLSIKNYLDTVDAILKMKAVYLFQPSYGKLHTYYLKEDQKMPHLRDKIAKECNIRSDKQMIFFNYIEITDDSTQMSYFSSNTKKLPLIFIEKSTDNMKPYNCDYIWELKASDQTIISYANDICCLLHRIKKELKYNVRTYDHIYNAICILNSLTLTEMRSCEEVLKHISLPDELIGMLENVSLYKEFQFENTSNQEYKQSKAQYKNVKDLIIKLKSSYLNEEALDQKRETLENIHHSAIHRFKVNDEKKLKIMKNFQDWKRKTFDNLQNIREFKKKIFSHIKAQGHQTLYLIGTLFYQPWKDKTKLTLAGSELRISRARTNTLMAFV